MQLFCSGAAAGSRLQDGQWLGKAGVVGELHACNFCAAMPPERAGRLAPAPVLTGLVRRDLFRRDLHYPADLGSLFAAPTASLASARRDLQLVRRLGTECTRASVRVQLVAMAALTCFCPMRTSALERLCGTTWQGLETALLPLLCRGLLVRDQALWSHGTPRDREL